jgi:cytochrome c551/c552
VAETTDAPIVESKNDDPIADRSMSGILFISALVLMLTLAWALEDEIFGLRPWKNYQVQFVKSYTKFLKKLKPRQKRSEKEIMESADYKKLDSDAKEAQEAANPRTKEIDAEVSGLTDQINALTVAMQETRSKLAALTYETEQASDTGKASYRDKIEEVKKGPYTVELPALKGGAPEKKTLSYPELDALYAELKDRKAKLLAERVEVNKTANDLRKKRDDYLKDNMEGLSEAQIAGLIDKMNNFSYEIKQINVSSANLVDRCESCHLGMREPLTLTKDKSSIGKQLFISHPDKELLQKHDPEHFGCSPCHGGNGRATSSIVKAHGKNAFWLWPLYDKENTEAGCQQCHAKDRQLADASTLNEGKELFQRKGCIGCHKYEGYDRESDGLFNAQQGTRNLEMERANDLREIDRLTKSADNAASNDEAQKLYAQADNLKITISQIDAKIQQLQQQAKYLMQDQKKIGPNLKDARMKLRKEWIPVWLKDNFAFRPETKMPHFRLQDDEIKAISAYIWQAAVPGPALPDQAPGDPEKGKQSLETRGCLACHSVGEGSERHGGVFATNLSREGEKANYNYIVRWVHNPRQRTQPYCPKEKKDIGPEDYAKKGLPYTFDLDHTKCPNDGVELQVQNMTPMPSFRLTEQEARDIASYLMTLKHNDASYADASYMDDKNLKTRGQALVKNYGCMGCHEIAGLEDEGRIGTELTQEGSKPIERLDFAMLTEEAKKDDSYDHKGFFDRKLKDPGIFDTGKEKAQKDKLKMPTPNLLNDQERIALTTFLLGSVESNMPKDFFYDPADQRKDVQEGYWVIKKYNCMGCHNIQIGQKTILQDLDMYQADGREKLPPRLTSEGARVNPEWLLGFLSNPSLDDKNLDQNGVRKYLTVRMPTFSFSPNELRALVNFFQAASAQPQPYIPTPLDALTDQERELGRVLFTSKAAPCLKCHLTGNAEHDKNASAPNFLLARERLKPGWTERWLLDPAFISPGTAMPSGLFQRQEDHWILKGDLPDSAKNYNGDHIKLLVRYMFQITPDEQARLIALAGQTGGATKTSYYRPRNGAVATVAMVRGGVMVAH